MSEENEVLRERLAVLEKRIDEIKCEVKSEVKSEIMEEIDYKIKNLMENQSEEEEKKNRVCNLIMYNVEESEKDEGVQRQTEDHEKIQIILKEGIKISEHAYHLKKALRLGKRREIGDKPRPLLIKFESPAEKWAILKKAKELKNFRHPKLGRVIIAPDLTPKEQEKDRTMRKQLKDKQEKGEQGWYIKNGKLVQQNFPRRRRENAT